METIRVRIKLGTKGQPGIQLDHLMGVFDEAGKFLRAISEESGLDNQQWLAAAPKPGSFAVDFVYPSPVTKRRASTVKSKIRRLSKYKPGKTKPPKIGRDAIVHYAKIPQKLPTSEPVSIGVYSSPGDKKPTWTEMSRERCEKILSAMAEVVLYFGSVQGTLHSINVGADPNFFQIRDIATGSLVRCTYKPELHSSVISCLRTPGRAVLVSGHVSASRATRSIDRIEVDKLRLSEELSAEDFDRFFGSAPNLTGELSTEEFIEKVRRG